MEKRLLSTLVLVLVFVSGWAQLPDNRIFWKKDALLRWEDFKGTPGERNSFDANTNSGISYSWSLKKAGDQTDFLYKVESFFLPDHSWVKPGKSSDHLLSHEQLHFDITELHARKLRKFMESFDPDSVRDIKKVLKEFYSRNEAERAEMQRRFDFETGHSQNAELQLQWQLFVKEELQKLEDFSS